jgi:hypothetical protein
MKEYIDDILDGFSDGFRFVIAVCSVLLCLILRDVRHDVREIKKYLVPEIEEVVDTIYVHKKDTIIIQYDYRNEEE